MDLDKIVEKMQKGIVLLEYTSLISGKKKQREMTLCADYVPEAKQIKNSNKWSQTYNDKLICYDIEFQKWDDIDKDTILSWKQISYTPHRMTHQIPDETGEQIQKDYKQKQKELTELNPDGD